MQGLHHRTPANLNKNGLSILYIQRGVGNNDYIFFIKVPLCEVLPKGLKVAG